LNKARLGGKYAANQQIFNLEGGDRGGEVVAAGTPEEVCALDASYTGQYLRPFVCKG